MGNFLEKLKESVQEHSYYETEREVLNFIADGKSPLLESTTSSVIAISPEGTGWLDSALMDSEAVLTDDELHFMFEAVSGKCAGENLKFFDIKATTVTVTVLEQGSVSQQILFRSSSDSYTQNWTGGDQSSLAPVINQLQRALNKPTDKTQRKLVDDFNVFSRGVKREREGRLNDYPELSGDFWPDVTRIYEYSTCFEEFSSLIDGTSVHSMRDRHLSRLSRATLAFDDDELASGVIYRAVPVDVDDIEAGDWVSFSEDYCEDHAELMRSHGEDYHIISRDVECEVAMLTDENEYVYLPDGCWGDGVTSLKEVWNDINTENKPTYYEAVDAMYEAKVKSKRTSAPKP